MTVPITQPLPFLFLLFAFWVPPPPSSEDVIYACHPSDSKSCLDVDLQLPVKEGSLAELDGLAPPLGLGGVRVGGGLAPEEAAEGRRHGQ